MISFELESKAYWSLCGELETLSKGAREAILLATRLPDTTRRRLVCSQQVADEIHLRAIVIERRIA
jgi:hypothetical protein